MIYAIQTEHFGYLKFGISNRPKTRLRNLQTACPLELCIVAFADWPDEVEGQIHKYLEHYRVRGEWFEDSYKGKLVIQCLQAGEPGLERFLVVYSEYLASITPVEAQTLVERLINRHQQQRERFWESDKGKRAMGALADG